MYDASRTGKKKKKEKPPKYFLRIVPKKNWKMKNTKMH